MNGEMQLGIELLIVMLAGAYLLRLVFSQFQLHLNDTNNDHRGASLRLVYPGVVVGLQKKSLFGQHPVRR